MTGVVIVAAQRASTTAANTAVNTAVNNVLNGPVGGGEIDLNQTTNTPFTDPKATVYTNAQAGIIVHGVPQAQETVSGEITTIDFGAKDSLSILSPDLEGIVRESIGGITETTLTIDGVPGVSMTGSSAKDGTSRTLVLITHNNHLFVFDGSQEFLASLPSNVEFE